MSFRITTFLALVGLGLAASPGVQAVELTAYTANQAHGAAITCLRDTPMRCGDALQRYLEAAAHQLEDRRAPQTGQELRLRTTQSRLRNTAKALRQRAVEQVAMEPQAQAEVLEHAVRTIDDLLSSARLRARTATVPALAATPVQIVDLLPLSAPAQTPAALPPPSPPSAAALPALPSAWILDTAHAATATGHGAAAR